MSEQINVPFNPLRRKVSLRFRLTVYEYLFLLPWPPLPQKWKECRQSRNRPPLPGSYGRISRMCAVQCKGDNSSGRKLLFLQSRRNDPDGVFAWWKFEKTKAENPILRLIGKNYCKESSNDEVSSTVKGCVIIMLLALVNVSLALFLTVTFVAEISSPEITVSVVTVLSLK